MATYQDILNVYNRIDPGKVSDVARILAAAGGTGGTYTVDQLRAIGSPARGTGGIPESGLTGLSSRSLTDWNTALGMLAASAPRSTSSAGSDLASVVKPDYSVIGAYLPSLQRIAAQITSAQVPRNEQHFRNTVLGFLTGRLTGQSGGPGTLYALPGQYTSEIDQFVTGQADTQRRALGTQYAQAQQDILHTAAVQGFNPAGALGELARNYQQQLANIENNASTLRFNAAEAERNRIAQSILPPAVSTSEFGIDIPNRRIAALSGAFGNIASGASNLQNAAFTPAQIQAQIVAAQIGADTQAQIAAMNAQNDLALQQLRNRGAIDAANAGQVSPWTTLGGSVLGDVAGAVANRAGQSLSDFLFGRASARLNPYG